MLNNIKCNKCGQEIIIMIFPDDPKIIRFECKKCGNTIIVNTVLLEFIKNRSLLKMKKA